MATECTEFQEKSGLKRKLTGPPRLLLGKSKSPFQKEKKSDSRKERLGKNNDKLMDVARDYQCDNEAGARPQEMLSEGSEMAFTEAEDKIQTDLQVKCLESTPGQDGKKRVRRSKARVSIGTIFSPTFLCVRRRKKDKSVQNAEKRHKVKPNLHDVQTNNDTFYSQGVTRRCEKGSRKFCLRMWPVFKKHSSRGKKQDEAGQCGDSINEIALETSDQFMRTVDGSGHDADKRFNELGKTSEDMAEIPEEHEEHWPDLDKGKDKSTAIVTLSAEVIVDSNTNEDAFQTNIAYVTDEEEPSDRDLSNPQLICLEESNSDAGSPPEYFITEVVDLDVTVPSVKQCKPLITIEDVHTSDEEKHDPFENLALQCETLSALLSLNAPCYHKTKDTLKTLGQNDYSEFLLKQTALALVHAAISGAIEQLSAEDHQLDLDHL